MKLFAKIRSLFNKNIGIAPHQRHDLVSFVKLRGNKVKLNGFAEVEDDYNLIFVYYNKVCDILTAGRHKLNEDNLPKLFRYSKTPVGLSKVLVKSIVTDAYYIKLKEFPFNSFKTIDRVIAYNDGEKVKLKLEGTFSIKVIDPLKFMKALCNDYAIIRNKKTMKEICSTVGFEISKALNSVSYSVDDYIFNKEKIIATIEEKVNAHTYTFGVEVSNFCVSNLVIPKKSLNEKQLEKLQNKEQPQIAMDSDISKIVEERLNNLQNDLNVVFVGNNKENKNVDKEVANSSDKNNDVNFISKNENNYDNKNNSTQNKSHYSEKASEENKRSSIYDSIIIPPTAPTNQPEPKIMEEKSSSKQEQVSHCHKAEGDGLVETKNYGQEQQKERLTRIHTNYANEKPQKEPSLFATDDLIIDDALVDRLIEKIDKRKNEKKNYRILEILANAGLTSEMEKPKPKKITKKCPKCQESISDDAKYCPKCGNMIDGLKICVCCGAKNFPNAQNCCLCKSKLD